MQDARVMPICEVQLLGDVRYRVRELTRSGAGRSRSGTLTNVKHYVKNYDTFVVRDNAPSARSSKPFLSSALSRQLCPRLSAHPSKKLACYVAISAVDAGALD